MYRDGALIKSRNSRWNFCGMDFLVASIISALFRVGSFLPVNECFVMVNFWLV